MAKTKISEKEWKEKLTKKQYHVLREKGTEPPFTGKYVNFDEEGNYLCAACGNELFDSGKKFSTHCGWPSFYDAKKGAVDFREDTSHLLHRTEVICGRCGSHLGHVFDDGPAPTGKRFCINSVSISFSKTAKKKQK